MDAYNQFLMIGNKDAGKTTYMICAYAKLLSAFHDISFSTDVVNSRLFSNLYQEIRRGHYPNATNKKTSYSFSVNYSGQEIGSFIWSDYRGGVINEFSSDEYHELVKAISKSSGAIFFIDSHKLYNNSLDTRIREIIKLLGKGLVSLNRTYNISIALTKFDLLSYSQQHNTDHLLAPLSSLYSQLHLNHYINFKTIPISCTSKKLINVEYPLMYMLSGTLRYAAIERMSKIDQEDDTLTNMWNTKVAKYFGFRGLANELISAISGQKSDREILLQKMEILRHKKEQNHNISKKLDEIDSIIYGTDCFESYYQQ